MIMLLRNISNIRDVIAFPKTQTGHDVMCQAPNTIDERQLKETHVKVVMPPAPPPKA
jgi:aspartyl-tRNA synthetase